MATWTEKANSDMQELVGMEGVANVNSVRAAISQWADNAGANLRTRAFQGTLRFEVIASAQNREILSVGHD